MDSALEYKLKRILGELKGKRGRHTELVSVYIPSGYDLNNIMGQLEDERGTATNIKSTSTKKNVVDALERLIQFLKLYKRTPPNGLALFCGNVSERDGVQDLRVWSVEPPEPITIRLYRCDKEFITQPLEDLVTPKDVYGLVVIDNKTATVATLKGNNYNIVKKLTSGYHGKHRAGGQSHRRFERIIEEQSHEFKKRVAEVVLETFMPISKDFKGFVVGGPAATKEDFLEGDYLHHELRKRIIAVKDITYTDESGIRELIDAAKDDLGELEMIQHKKLLQRFMKHLVEDGPVAYGSDMERALDAGAVDVLLLSDKLSPEEIDRLYEKAKQSNAKLEVISTEFEEGFQLWNTFKGKAALLRYRIGQQ
ncbi:MAG: peptide chain release factor aRF-1 [Candidatus Altiarchaeota archaeon]|nr:peptide chain release factor aRF-1 [Candidatus Altiarchaeota archaeon]